MAQNPGCEHEDDRTSYSSDAGILSHTAWKPVVKFKKISNVSENSFLSASVYRMHWGKVDIGYCMVGVEIGKGPELTN